MKLSSIAWSFSGLGLPLLVALLTIPPLLHTLGPERFGLLSLAWTLTAMSGLFDLGLGRATTRLVADQLGRGDMLAPRRTVAAAVRMAALAGIAGASLLGVATLLGLDGVMRITDVPATELRQALWLLTLAIPLQTLIATYRGVSEACQRFRGISLLRMALGVSNFVAPLLVAQLSTHLAALIAVLVVARLLACIGFRALAMSALPPGPSTPITPDDRHQLLHSGGWFTVSALVSPLLVQADRFFIGALLPAAAIATYTVPFDMITQLLIGVTAVSTVAFPSITSLLQSNPLEARQQLRRWLARVAIGMAVVCAFVAVLLPVGLSIWVGNALPSEAVAVGRWLCLGVWINAIGSMYFAWLHAQGRFKATGILHMIELPLYIAVLLVLLKQFGVLGAAFAWTARVSVDSICLAWLARARSR